MGLPLFLGKKKTKNLSVNTFAKSVSAKQKTMAGSHFVVGFGVVVLLLSSYVLFLTGPPSSFGVLVEWIVAVVALLGMWFGANVLVVGVSMALQTPGEESEVFEKVLSVSSYFCFFVCKVCLAKIEEQGIFLYGLE